MPTTTTSDPAVEPAVELREVEVRYRAAGQRIASFKEYVLARLAGRVRYQHLMALDGVSLNIEPGESFGVVGRNGAGKSTLLKVIARVLHPTSGRVLVRGRVAPMLELGAGFHPDLTGVENILLNSAILGYSSREVRARLDEVVEFAELEGFIDAPIRTYSSGMQARLGFAVATFDRPDVLVLDEVLAVGDLGFQEKCLERIASFRGQGSSVVLVSHSLELIGEHCTRAVWLERGEVAGLGPTDEVLERYREFFVAAQPLGGEPHA